MNNKTKKKGFWQQAGWPSIITAIASLVVIILFAFVPNNNSSDYHGIFGVIAGFFANSILGVSRIFGNSYAFGIIIFTVLIRFLILPLMVYAMGSQKNMAKVTPQIKKIQDKYRGKRDRDSMMNMQAETSAVYKAAGVNPYSSMLPLLIQLPVIWALFQAIQSTSILRTGSLLWLQLGQTDPYYVLPFLAALFTFLSSWMSTMAMGNSQPGFAKAMPYIFPILIFFPALAFPAAISLYWTTTNAFQLVQTFILQNPFKARAERRAEAKAEADRKKAIRKTLKKARKKRK
ncbi:YidC/Oxa1 family membrane protein insertase [Oenococcus alcoholitolerans]|uniref:Membrane protein n=1 Tax=Oenococcus alcoholitolerans TaxID=931074 RepID=A0ABR4XSH2_9LACO|nr:membrane protein [Oenococcus alcoholitolerans]